MTPWRTADGSSYLVRIYDEHGVAHVRALGTQDYDEAKSVEALLALLRKRRRWNVLQLMIDRHVIPVHVYDWDHRGTLTERVADVERRLTEGSDVDLSPLVEEWNGKGRRSQSDKYVRQVRVMIPKGERFPRSRFTKGAVLTFLAGLEVDGPTKNRYRAALLQFGRWLVQRDVIPANPVREVDGYPENAPRMVWYTREQAKDFIRALTGPQKALEALMAGSAIEWQACKRLRRRDINVDEHTVFADGGKNRWRKRTVVVTEDWCWSIVERYVRDMHPNTPLFTMTDKAALRAHHEAAESAGLPPSHLHDWRHSYAIWNLRDGVEPAFLRPQLGHAPGSTMLERVYQAWIPSPAERKQRALTAQSAASKGASKRSRRTS